MISKSDSAVKTFSVESWAIERVIPYARNPRKNSGAVAKVAASLKEFGWRQPIVVDEASVVIVGHTRLLAARSLGMTEVPVHVAAGLTKMQAKAYRIADNRTGEEAEWDYELLPLELTELRDAGFDLDLTGFDAEKIGAFDAEEADAPELRDGDRAPFQQMTFTVHDSQHETIAAALAKAKAGGHGSSDVNENGNGNALAAICREYLGG